MVSNWIPYENSAMIASMALKDTKIPYLIKQARRQAGLSLRQLSKRANTSHSTIAAYESGKKTPSAEVLLRLLDALDFDLVPTKTTRLTTKNLEARAQEFEAVLDLADQFPARHSTSLNYPVFPNRV